MLLLFLFLFTCVVVKFPVFACELVWSHFINLNSQQLTGLCLFVCFFQFYFADWLRHLFVSSFKNMCNFYLFIYLFNEAYAWPAVCVRLSRRRWADCKVTPDWQEAETEADAPNIGWKQESRFNQLEMRTCCNWTMLRFRNQTNAWRYIVHSFKCVHSTGRSVHSAHTAILLQSVLSNCFASSFICQDCFMISKGTRHS